MTQISRLSGIGSSVTPFRIDPNMSTAQLDLLLMRERLELEQLISRRLAGVGTTLDNTYQYDIRLINEALANLHQPQKIAGIGAAIGKTRVGKFLQKVSKEVKTGAKAVAHTVSAPVRLAAKGILEITLPKASPAFLYLFLKPEQLDGVPDSVRSKRKAAENQAKFIVQGLGMKEDHFMGIIRNGIMKRLGRTPEQELERRMKAYQPATAPPAQAAPAAPAAPTVIAPIPPAATLAPIAPPQMVFDEQYYYDVNPDVAAAFNRQRGKGLEHFNNNGRAEGRKHRYIPAGQAQMVFDEQYYYDVNPDVAAAFNRAKGAGYQHFLNNGKAEGRLHRFIPSISGIGVVPPGLITAAIGAVIEIIKKLVSLLKGKKPESEFSEDDAPDEDDFDTPLSQEIINQFRTSNSLVKVPGTNTLVRVTSSKPSATTSYARQSFTADSGSTDDDGSTGGSSFNLSSPIVLGGAALLAFILLKNK